MSDHNILWTEGNGQLAQPSVPLIESRRFADPARAWSFAGAAAVHVERRVWALSADSYGQLPSPLKALE